MADWDPAATWNREEKNVNDDNVTYDSDTYDTDGYETDTYETEPVVAEDQPAEPVPETVPSPVVERFKKRRVIIGAVFLVLGLAGVLSDLFEISGSTALAIAGLAGSVALLSTLVLGARRNTALFSQT